MTIDNEIIQFTEEFGKYKIKEWSWYGKPHSLIREFRQKIDTDSEVHDVIDEMILFADESECLTSPISYVRECKRWMMQNDYKSLKYMYNQKDKRYNDYRTKM